MIMRGTVARGGPSPPKISERGEVAQLVEHTTENRGVAGSIPALAISGAAEHRHAASSVARVQSTLRSLRPCLAGSSHGNDEGFALAIGDAEHRHAASSVARVQSTLRSLRPCLAGSSHGNDEGFALAIGDAGAAYAGGMDRFTGGCLCGDVRILASGLPYRVGICHCLDCRKHSGTLFYSSAVFPQGAVTI